MYHRALERLIGRVQFMLGLVDDHWGTFLNYIRVEWLQEMPLNKADGLDRIRITFVLDGEMVSLETSKGIRQPLFELERLEGDFEQDHMEGVIAILAEDWDLGEKGTKWELAK